MVRCEESQVSAKTFTAATLPVSLLLGRMLRESDGKTPTQLSREDLMKG